MKIGFKGFWITFILMMLWGIIGIFLQVEVIDSPISFTLKRYWPAVLVVASLALGVIAMVFATSCSFLYSRLKALSS